ncbi:MAG TPA: hypothetical protein VGD69_26510 [Herpetosiphonaceae bacterium]
MDAEIIHHYYLPRLQPGDEVRASAPCPSVTRADARALLHDDRLVVLALETSGHGGAAEIVGVAMLNRHGQVLLHTRMCPTRPIPVLADAPPLEVVWPILAALLTNRIIVSFQVATDRRALRQTARRLGATLMYTEWRGIGAVACRSTQQMPTCYPNGHALTEARTVLAARPNGPTNL